MMYVIVYASSDPASTDPKKRLPLYFRKLCKKSETGVKTCLVDENATFFDSKQLADEMLAKLPQLEGRHTPHIERTHAQVVRSFYGEIHQE